MTILCEKLTDWKDLDAGKDWRREEKRVTAWDGWMASSTTVDMSLSKLQETVKDREAWHVPVHGVSKSQTWLMVEQQCSKDKLTHLMESKGFCWFFYLLRILGKLTLLKLVISSEKFYHPNFKLLLWELNNTGCQVTFPVYTEQGSN